MLKIKRNFISSVKYNLEGSEVSKKTALWWQLSSFGIKKGITNTKSFLLFKGFKSLLGLVFLGRNNPWPPANTYLC